MRVIAQANAHRTAAVTTSASARHVVAATSIPSGVSTPAASPAPALDRRMVLAAPLLVQLALSASSLSAAYADEGDFATVKDKTLAYEFKYPTRTNKGDKLNITYSRRPEKYSSAAPLTVDARQRIVVELVDLTKSFTVSVSVGFPSPILTGRPTSEWKPKDIAESVLIDKSTARVSTGQRVALNTIEELKVEERDGQQYVIYEHISQGSPNYLKPGAKETFRHALSVSTIRNGTDGTPYVYTFNIACPDELWDTVEPNIREAAASFKLVPTTRDYVPPNQDPWLFF